MSIKRFTIRYFYRHEKDLFCHQRREQPEAGGSFPGLVRCGAGGGFLSPDEGHAYISRPPYGRRKRQLHCKEKGLWILSKK